MHDVIVRVELTAAIPPPYLDQSVACTYINNFFNEKRVIKCVRESRRREWEGSLTFLRREEREIMMQSMRDLSSEERKTKDKITRKVALTGQKWEVTYSLRCTIQSIRS